ncbi:hypothetical protein GCM10028819_30040 [Spirosoma humi]
MMDTYTAIFGDLADAYVKVHNQIPDDNTHLFRISSVGPYLDLLPMLSIFQTHGVTVDRFIAETTPDGVTVAVLVRDSSYCLP